MNESLKNLLRPFIRPVKRALQPLLYSRRPPLCENVVVWALDAGYPVKRIHEPFLLDLPIRKMAGFEIDYASLTKVDCYPHRAEIQVLNFTPWRDLA